MKQQEVLYSHSMNARVPSFLTTAGSNRNFMTTSQRKGHQHRSPSKEIKQFTTIDTKISTQEPVNALTFQKYTPPKKFRSEEGDFITNTNSFQYLKLCNRQLLDTEVTRRRQKTKVPSMIEVTVQEKKKQKKKKYVNYSKNFTLQNLRPLSDHKNYQFIHQQIDQFKINKEQTISILENTQGAPQFDKYKAKEPIRRYDMVFNVKQLMRLQDKREKEFRVKKETDSELQLEIIKRKNQIQMLLQNSKKLEDLKTASGGILEYIQQQDLLQDDLVKQFGEDLQIQNM